MTFTTPYVTIGGIPSAIPTVFEYTNQKMASAYYNAILAFVRVLAIQPTADNPYPTTMISAGNVAQVNAALYALTNLAKYGVIVTSSAQVFYPTGPVDSAFLAAHNLSKANPPSAGKSSYKTYLMTMTMAQDYDQILRSLAAVGVDTNASGSNVPDVNLMQLQQWRDLAIQVSAIARNVQAAELEGFGGGMHLQALIEINYVQTGNLIISENMAALQSALNITNQVLITLGQMQSLHNNVTTRSSAFNFNYQSKYGASKPSGWSPIYQSAASAYYNTPVTPIVVSSLNLVSGYMQLIAIRNTLSAEITKLSATTPASALNNSTSLYGTLKTVMNDLNTVFVDHHGNPIISTSNQYEAVSAFSKWMLDNYSSFNTPSANQAGQIQNNITFAITAGENLNDTQKETVRNYLFIFEEYYKSASSALQAITQIIQKMAQNIAR
ncbi:MAG: hypothetical protein HWD61_09280 [Parachlamydiaceae bacterium]|nr:MAG: hypothetical protein HWD61_09280 [Parachlamydiaceae bacterium]